MGEEKKKEIWKEIYALADKLAINKERLKYLVEDVIGKRAETIEEAEEVLTFLKEVDKKFHGSLLSLDEAIEAVKKERGAITELTDEEVVRIEKEIEEEQEPIREPDKATEAEVVEEEHWDKTVEIDEGMFMFREEGEKLLCKSGTNGNVYELEIDVPKCRCLDFVANKKEKEWCKHLKAAAAAGYDVKELPKVPAKISEALEEVKPEKKRGRKKKEEETVTLAIMDKKVELGVQIPTELILTEEKAVEMIRNIIGDSPKKEDVIMSYAGVTELSASVIIALAQYIGIRYIPIAIEEEKQRMNIGELYMASASEEQKSKYGAVAKLMGEVDITTRCKVTTLSGWRDNTGNIRIGIGTKEEILTPHDLADIVKRGASFIRTKAETKSARKSILNALPVTEEGIIRKICRIYHWEI